MFRRGKKFKGAKLSDAEYVLNSGEIGRNRDFKFIIPVHFLRRDGEDFLAGAVKRFHEIELEVIWEFIARQIKRDLRRLGCLLGFFLTARA